MVDVAFAIPGDLGLPTGGYAYDRRIIGLLPEYGITATHVRLPGTFPAPTAGDLAQAEKMLTAVAPDTPLMIDGLAYGALPVELVRRIRAPVIALVHHPLCLESGISERQQHTLRQTETAALALARHVVVTSRTTADILRDDFHVPSGSITIAEPGTDPSPRARGSGGDVVQMLAVGSVVPRKGYDLLVEALAGLKSLKWQLTIAGALDRNPQTVAALRRQIAAAGLDGRITLAGAVDDAHLAALYDGADLFVMSSRFEGYGMVLTEALARGLPIVTTTGGAAGDTVPDGAALKVMAGSARALMWVIGRIVNERELRLGYADAAWAAATQLPRWSMTAQIIADLLRNAKS